MRVAIIATINYEPPNLERLPVDDAEKVANADIAIAVYQTMTGDSQAAVVKGEAEVEIFDAI